MVPSQEDALAPSVFEDARAGAFGIEAGVRADRAVEAHAEVARQSVDVSEMHFNNALAAAVRADSAIDPRLDLRGE
jgi:hypothetical protein